MTMQQDRSGAKLPGMAETEKGFSLLRTDTIQLWAWLQGTDPLNDQLLKSISEDISYRIRETTDNAANYMHHCKRSRLKTSDLNKAFQMSNIDKTFGYSNKEAFSYNRVETGSDDVPPMTLYELNEKFVELKLVEEEETDLRRPRASFSSSAPHKNVYGRWLIVNGNHHNIAETKSPDQNYSFNLDDGSCYSNVDDELAEHELSAVNLQLDSTYRGYFEIIVSVLTNANVETSDDDLLENEKMLAVILNDLKINPKLQPILPYLINLIYQTIQSLSSVSNNETVLASKVNLEFLHRCVDVLKHVVLNPNLFLAPKGIFAKVLSCLLFCTMQSTVFSAKTIDDGLLLRENASFVMVMFLRIYQRFSLDTIRYLIRNFFSPNFPSEQTNAASLQYYTIYGILTTFINFGGQMIHDYYAKLVALLAKLESSDRKTLIEILIIQLILKCFVVYFKWTVKKHHYSPKTPAYSYYKIFTLYQELVNMFGDAFTNQVPNFLSLYKAPKLALLASSQVSDSRTRMVKMAATTTYRDHPSCPVSQWFEESPGSSNSDSNRVTRSIRLTYGYQHASSSSKTSQSDSQLNGAVELQLFRFIGTLNQRDKIVLKRKFATEAKLPNVGFSLANYFL